MTPHPLPLAAVCVLLAFTALALAGSRAAIGSRDVSNPAVTSRAYDDYLAPASACPADDLTTLVAAQQYTAMLCLIDFARAARGVRTLVRSRQLGVSAQIKAADIVRCGDFSHTACGRSPEVPFERAGYITAAVTAHVGENIAYGSDRLGSARSIMRAWLESDSHREILFDDRWLEQGVSMRKPAVFLGVRSNAVWVAHFGCRRRTSDTMAASDGMHRRASRVEARGAATRPVRPYRGRARCAPGRA